MSKNSVGSPSYTMESLSETMKIICRAKYIATHRAGDTGIGKTLEDLLGITENSIQAPDLGEIELKATRKNRTGKVTLFTKAPKKRGVNRTVLREKYGYKTKESKQLNDKVNVLFVQVNGEKYNTLKGKPFLKLERKDGKIYIKHANDGLLEDVYWEEDQLTQAFNKKFPSGKLLLVRADSKGIKAQESFWFNEAYLLEGFSATKMMAGLMSGLLDIEIRLGIHKSGKSKGHIHDNGTAIRVSEKDLDACFEKKTPLVLE